MKTSRLDMASMCMKSCHLWIPKKDQSSKNSHLKEAQMPSLTERYWTLDICWGREMTVLLWLLLFHIVS